MNRKIDDMINFDFNFKNRSKNKIMPIVSPLIYKNEKKS